MVKVKFQVAGMKELEKSLKKLGKVPQKHVTASAKKGMNIVKKEAKINVPEDTGDLRKGITSIKENSNKKAKSVYRIVFDSSMNDVFQKPIKDPGSRGGKGNNTGYYPVAQEYGFFAGDGNFIPGFRFVSDSFIDNAHELERAIVRTMKQKIDAEIAKGGLK